MYIYICIYIYIYVYIYIYIFIYIHIYIGTCSIVAVFVETSALVPRHASNKCSSRERLLSVAGQVVTAKRVSLDPHTVRLLVFLC